MNNQTQTLPADKIIRALWYAWQLPELDRHQAILSRCTDPAVAEAYAAIKGGKEGLARAYLQNGAACQLLALAFNFPPSEEMLSFLRQRRKESGLPDDFFKRVTDSPVMVFPELDPGLGEWPKEPAHTCQGKEEGGAVITIRGQATAVSPIIVPSWRDTEKRPGCRGCQHKRAKREARKVLWEGMKRPLWGKFATAEEYRRFTNRTRKRRKEEGIAGAYAAYPMTDGRYFVIHDQEREGGQPIGDDRTEVYNLLLPIVNDTPDDKRISASGGWGGNWQGTRGDGRVKRAKKEGQEVDPAFQVWSTEGVDRIVQTLGGQIKAGVRSYTVKISAKEAFKRLAEEGIAVYGRDSNGQTLTDFINHFPGLDVAVGSDGQLTLIHDRETAVVTHNAQENPQTPCTLCVTEGGQMAEDAPDLYRPPLPIGALQADFGGRL